MRSISPVRSLYSVAWIVIAQAAQPASAQASAGAQAKADLNNPPAVSSDQPQTDLGSEIIVTGTRSADRRARDSTSPITVIDNHALITSGRPSIAETLVQIEPSVTVNAIGSDTGALTSSIRLRGLNPNDTLVLVDGKRRHTTANFYPGRGPQQGSTPVDLNLIPATAIDHIEILQDGAAAQYGSDAVAGVVNIILKKGAHGGSFVSQVGANLDADTPEYGLQEEASTDAGFSIGRAGYLHLSTEFFHTNHFVARTTDYRSLPNLYPQYAIYALPGSVNKIASTPKETRETVAANLGLPLGDFAELYALGTFGHRNAEAFENYRTPDIAKYPNGTLLYPRGFSPEEVVDENDYGATLGVRGADLGGFAWDLSSVYGADYDSIGNHHTANTGLLSTTGSTPTNTHNESFKLAQWTNNLDLRRSFKNGSRSWLTLAFGAEYRRESYTIKPGEYASYALGGTQAFPGILPSAAGTWSRSVVAGYGDVDVRPVPKLDLDVAGRFEHYSDAGNAKSGKLAARYDFSPAFALRGTVSNGFRAPTLPEEHYSAINIFPTGARGTLAANSAAAALIGAKPLTPEHSINFSAGSVFTPAANLSITVDAYQIRIKDAIIAGGNYSGQQALDAITLAGNSLPVGLPLSGITANYLSNGATTRTRGLDITANWRVRFQRAGTLNLNFSADLSRTHLLQLKNDTTGAPLLNAQGIAYYTTASPSSKFVLGGIWDIGRWEFVARETRWGETKFLLTYQDQAPPSLKNSTTNFIPFTNSARFTMDVSIGRDLGGDVHFTVGANNVFNAFPKRVPFLGNYLGGAPYVTASSGLGITGAYYYASLRYKY